MEVIKLNTCYSPTDTGGNGLAGITNKVWNRKDLRRFLIVVLGRLKVPVRGKDMYMYVMYVCVCVCVCVCVLYVFNCLALTSCKKAAVVGGRGQRSLW